METLIHPSARIAHGAEIGEGVRIGPFCTVGSKVTIGDGAELISHVVIDGLTRIGAGARLFPFCTVGMAPQDLKYKGEPTETEIGARTVLREHVTVHRGTVTGTALTHVGDDCLLMAVTHVAHDCHVGNGVVIANNSVMGGHVTIGDNAVIGGAAAVHQFVQIGRAAMIGGMAGVEADVIPFGTVIGNRARLAGLNIIGLRRRGYDHAQVHRVRAAFRALFVGAGVFGERLEAVRAEFGADPLVGEMIGFIDARRARKPPHMRGLVRAAVEEEDDAG